MTPERTRGIAVPSYFGPGPLWARMERARPGVGMAIINPSNGPGAARDSRYAAQVKNSQSAGLTVLGYVHTAYGARRASAVRADVDAYCLWYGVDGVFFDEASTERSYASSYYAALYDHVQAHNGKALTILNPGRQTAECYMAVADVIVTFEGSYGAYVGAYPTPSWVGAYPPRRFWHLVYAAQGVRKMQKAVRLSEKRGAGWVYVTPYDLPNPWASLPPEPYWSRQLSAVEAAT